MQRLLKSHLEGAQVEPEQDAAERPRTERLEYVVAHQLLGMQGRAVSAAAIANAIGRNEEALRRPLERLSKTGLIDLSGRTATQLRRLYRLNAIGIWRAQWAERLGVHALLGLPTTLHLRIFNSLATADHALTEIELPAPDRGEIAAESVLVWLVRAGFIYDLRDYFAIGTSQPQQWRLTRRGEDLAECLAGPPA